MRKKIFKKNFNETPKFNSYFFQAHSLLCTHNITKQLNSLSKSELKTMTTMLYFFIQRYGFEPKMMDNHFAMFSCSHILHKIQTSYIQQRNVNPIHFQWFGELFKHTYFNLQVHLS